MSDDAKKIAVLVRDRQGEALRMALGLTLADDAITVFNIGAPIEVNDANELSVESLEMMECELFSVNEVDANFQSITMQLLPEKLLEFTHVIPY